QAAHGRVGDNGRGRCRQYPLGLLVACHFSGSRTDADGPLLQPARRRAARRYRREDSPVTDSTLPLLEVRDLAVSFDVRGGRINAVDGVSLSIRPGETLGVVGESGSGKSVMAYSLVGLLAGNGRIDRGQIRFDGQDLRGDRHAMAKVRGRGIAFIFQNPRAALNPIRSIGDQVRDALEASGRSSRKDSARRALELLEQVRIERAKDRLRAFPHELSGGMCQRILIAMALAAEPKLLIADEPTTGLDV